MKRLSVPEKKKKKKTCIKNKHTSLCVSAEKKIVGSAPSQRQYNAEG